MQRETKTIATPSGNKVEIYSYLTAREANSVKEELYRTLKLDVSSAGGSDPISTKISGEFVLEQEKKLLGIIVKSIDGVSENILETLLNMRNDDYQFIVAEVNKIHQGNFSQVK